MGSSVGNVYGNLEGYTPVEYLFGSEYGSEVGSSVGISYGKVAIKLEGYPLGDDLGPRYGTVGVSSGGSSDGEVFNKREG